MATIDKIEKVLDLFVRPRLQTHGGNIALKSFADGKLDMYFTGCCSSCISGSTDTINWIKTILQEQFKEITNISVSQQTNPELIDFARKLLAKNENRH